MSASLPRVFGPYALLARLGQGAAGAAYLARPLERDRGVPSPVVVKHMHARLTENEEFLRRFRHEGEVAVRVSSPHVASVFDVGAHDDQPFIAMEYVPGWTLGKLLGALGKVEARPSIAVAVELMHQLLTGLEVLHGARDEAGRPLDVVHRDLAPKNLMVGDDGVMRIIDLGLGKSRAKDWATTAGRVMGSPGYMAPEQIAGMDADRRADLYAAGVILHELLSGARYIPIGGAVEMLRQQIQKPFEPPSTLRAEIPAELDRVVRVAMARRPQERFDDAVAFREALTHAWPLRAGTAAVAEVSREVLGAELKARLGEVARLLAEGFEEDAEMMASKTVVYARRPGVRASTQRSVHDGDARDPGVRASTRRSVHDGDARDPSERASTRRSVQDGDARDPGASASGTGAPQSTVLTPTRLLAGRPAEESSPMVSVGAASLFEARAPRRVPVALWVVGALAIGFGGGAWFVGAKEAPAPMRRMAPSPAGAEAPRAGPAPTAESIVAGGQHSAQIPSEESVARVAQEAPSAVSIVPGALGAPSAEPIAPGAGHLAPSVEPRARVPGEEMAGHLAPSVEPHARVPGKVAPSDVPGSGQAAPPAPRAQRQRPAKGAASAGDDPAPSGAEPTAPEVASPAQIAARVRAVKQRVLTLRASLPEGAPRRAELDKLLARVALVRAAGDSSRAAAQVAELERAIAELE